jgi:hypothetical protein
MFFEYFPKGPREMTFIISTYHLIREEHPMRPPAVVYGPRGAAPCGFPPPCDIPQLSVKNL